MKKRSIQTVTHPQSPFLQIKHEARRPTAAAAAPPPPATLSPSSSPPPEAEAAAACASSSRVRVPRGRGGAGGSAASLPEPPPLDVTTDDDEEECSKDRDDDDDERSEEEECSSDRDERIGFEIQVTKTAGKRNRRVVRARVGVEAPLEAVWATLTDYEGLADFIPGLSECRLVDQQQGFARLYQVGEQDLALGFKFNAKGTIDCYEREMMEEWLPLPDARTTSRRRREIDFNMVQGDFKVFRGKWSVQEVVHVPSVDEFQTTLSYLVELEPKLWVPVRLLEGRISSEIKNNLVSIREQAQRIHSLQL